MKLVPIRLIRDCSALMCADRTDSDIRSIVHVSDDNVIVVDIAADIFQRVVCWSGEIERKIDIR